MAKKYDDVEAYKRERAKRAEAEADGSYTAEHAEQVKEQVHVKALDRPMAPASQLNVSTGAYFKRLIVFYIISMGTAMILYPLAVKYLYGWVIDNSTISGRKTKFVASDNEIFKFWIIHWVLSFFTVQIYMIWAHKRMLDFVSEHTVFADSADPAPSSKAGEGEAKAGLDYVKAAVMGVVNGASATGSKFTGGGVDYVIKNLGYTLLWVVTLGLAGGPLIKNFYGWCINQSVIEGQKLAFRATNSQINLIWCKMVLLTIVTLGIYGLFVQIRMHRFLIENTVLATK